MTARPITEEGAANLALAHLKQEPIANLTDNNARARAMNVGFGAARDAALRLRWWNFATAWTSPSAAAGITHPSLLKTVYPLPGDCLLVRFVQDAAADDWAVESYAADPAHSPAKVPVLVTNLNAPLVCYTARIADVNLWDADFVVAFGYQLAALSGAPFVSIGRLAELQGKAHEWREDSASIDAREKAPAQVSRATSWVTARRRGGSAVRW